MEEKYVMVIIWHGFLDVENNKYKKPSLLQLG